MIGVDADKGLVIIYLGTRRNDLLLSCGAAYSFAEALEKKAQQAVKDQAQIGILQSPSLQGGETGIGILQSPSLLLRETWEVRVQSYDGMVALRFTPPGIGAQDRIPLPPEAAQRLAAYVRFNAQQAAYKMRFVFQAPHRVKGYHTNGRC